MQLQGFTKSAYRICARRRKDIGYPGGKIIVSRSQDLSVVVNGRRYHAQYHTSKSSNETQQTQSREHVAGTAERFENSQSLSTLIIWIGVGCGEKVPILEPRVIGYSQRQWLTDLTSDFFCVNSKREPFQTGWFSSLPAGAP